MSLGRVQATIIVVSLLAFIMVLYSNWVTMNIFDHADRWDPLPENVQFAATLAHHSLERAVAGNEEIRLHKDIQGPLDEALDLCRDQLRARRRALGILKPVDDSEIKATVSALARELESLRDLLTQRFMEQATGSFDAQLEEACQKRLKAVLQLSQATRKSLAKIIGQERMVVSVIHTGNLVVLFGLFAGLIEFVLRQYRLNREMRLKQECQLALREPGWRAEIEDHRETATGLQFGEVCGRTQSRPGRRRTSTHLKQSQREIRG